MLQASRKTVISVLLVVHILLQPLAGGIGAASRPVASPSAPAPPAEDAPVSADSFPDLTVQETISATLAVTATVAPLPELSLTPLKAAISTSVASPTVTHGLMVTPSIVSLVVPGGENLRASREAPPTALRLSQVLTTEKTSGLPATNSATFPAIAATVKGDLPSSIRITSVSSEKPSSGKPISIGQDDASPSNGDTPLYLPYVESVGSPQQENANLAATDASPAAASLQTSTVCPDCLLLSVDECVEDLTSAELNTPTRLELTFDEPVDASVLLEALSRGSQMNVDHFVYRWKDHTGWYFPEDGMTAAEALDDFRRQHEQFLTTMLREQREALADQQDVQKWKSATTATLRHALIDSFEEQLARLKSDGLVLSGVTVEADTEQLQAFVKSATVSEHSSGCRTGAQQRAQNEPPEVRSIQTTDSNDPYPDNPWKFAPEKGKVKYDASSHYFFSEFFWEDISGFTNVHKGYEHEIRIWDVDYVEPGSGAYYSNLPDAYVDTGWLDNVSLPGSTPSTSFAIGSGAKSHASQIQKHKLYYIGIPVALKEHHGTVSYDVQAQLSSWAGEYDDGDWTLEPAEQAYCTGGLQQPVYCFFRDQIFSYNYYNDYASYGDLPFNYNTSGTYYWSKSYASPNEPGLVYPVNVTLASGSTVTFQWKSVVASQYNLRIALDPTLQDQILFDSNLAPPSTPQENVYVTLSGLPDNGALLWWSVRAAHPLGWGNWASSVSFQAGPSATPALPALDSPGNGSNVAATEVTFRWNPTTRAKTYQFQLALTNDFSASNLLIDTNVSYPYAGIIINGLPDNGWDFYWRVKASNALGSSGWSSHWHFTNGPSAAPTTPSLDSPGHGSTVSQADVTFRWNPAARAKDYQFQLALSNDFSAGNLLVDANVSYPYSGIIINGLPDNGWDFWWRVNASNSLGSSGWSSPRSFTNGPSAAPSTPGLDSPGNGTNTAATEVTFRWNPTARAKTYQFQLALTSDFNADNLLVDAQVSYPYIGIVINGLPDNGWEFWWRVKATNSLGSSGWSTGWRFTNGPSASPATPSLDTPNDGANVGATEMTFRWNPTARAKEYQFQLALSNDFSAGILLVDANVSYPYIGIVINGLPDNGWDFWWRVKASNSKGDSSWSAARRFINGPSAVPATPSLDSPGNGENRADSEVTFRWQPTARAQSYEFQLSLVNDFSADSLLVDAPVSYPYIGIVINGLPDNGWTFWWRVRASNGLGSSGWSTAYSLSNGPSASPDIPSLNAPSDGGNAAQTDVTFRWEPASRGLKYQYQLALTNDFSADGLLVDTEVSYPYVGVIINGLPDNGWDFYWRVKAGNDKGWSGWSAVWRVTNGPSALPEPPALMTPANGDNISGMLVEFRWTVGERAASQRLQLAVDSAFQQIVFDQDLGYYSGVNLTGFSDQGQQFWWRAKSSNALGESVWSESRSFVNGPGQRGQVEGIVSDGTNPLSRAVVSIGAKAAMSDASGRYVLRNIPAGSQRITTQRQGFASASQEIILAEGETQTINFSLVSDGTQAQIDVSPASLVFTGTSSVPLPANTRSAELGIQEAAGLHDLDIVPNQFVIGYKPGLRLLEMQQSIARLQEKDVPSYTTQIIKSHLPSGRASESQNKQTPAVYAVVKVVGDTDQFLNDIQQNSEVAFVQPRRYARAFEEPNDPLYFLQHALPQVQLPGAWARGSDAVRPLVAVVDTGIDYTHPDLAASFGPLKGYDFVDNDNDPMPDAVWESHGTHVTGIIAAGRNDGVGIAGAASVTLLSVRALDENGTGTQDDVADAINWAVSQGAQIVNLSLGGGADPILESAVQNAWDNGVLLVAASGNSSQNTVSYPAGYPEVIAVGALNQANELASFSSYGSQQELVAPGTTILSTYPQNDYAVASGTSMAAPLVTGVAALVLAHAPAFTNQQLRTALAVSADDLGASGRDNTYGYGRVNALTALDQILGPRNSQRFTVSNRGQRLLEVSDIAWQNGWLSATPRTFTVWPGTTQAVHVTVDSGLLAPAHYTDTITILSNDAANPSTTVDVALALELGTLSYSVPLLPGWNLISSPLQPVDTSVEQVLGSISGEFDLVYGYDGCDSANPWKSYDPNAASFANDLTQIDATTGHWIRSTGESTLLITGMATSPSIPLCTGWSLVGYPSLHIIPVEDATSSIAGCLTKIYAYEASDLSDPWKKYDPGAPAFANDLTQMTPGQGYWIQTNQNCTWTLDE